MARLLVLPASSSLTTTLVASPSPRLQSRTNDASLVLLSSRCSFTRSPLPVSAVTLFREGREEGLNQLPAVRAQAKPRKQSSAKPSAKPSAKASSSASETRSSAKAAVPPPIPRVSPPESLEDALRQASECVASAIRVASRAAEPMTLRQRKQIRGGGGGGAAGSSSARFQVEIPLRDDSPQALAETALDLVRRAVARVQWRGGAGKGATLADGGTGAAKCGVTLLFGPALAAAAAGTGKLQATGTDSAAAAAGAGAGGGGAAGGEGGAAEIEWDIASLDERQSVPRDAGLVCIVSPTEDQAGKIKSVLNSAGQAPVLLLNPAWDSTPAAAGDASSSSSLVAEFVKAFDVVYCFMPLAVKGLFGGNEGALMRVVGGGADTTAAGTAGAGGAAAAAGGAVPWVLLTQKRGENVMRPLTSLPVRPDAERIETVLYAAVAADSPVSKGVQFFKAIIGQGGGKAV